MPEIAYLGSELELFARAYNWKEYVRSQIGHYLSGVLEVGAGIGSNALLFVGGAHEEWLCLEPDPRLAVHISNSPTLTGCKLVVGTVADLPVSETFDSILYMDPLEHIEDDRAELRESARRLKPGGRLVVLAPAHQWLYTPFDRSIGHYRRYNAALLRRISPPGVTLERLRYLDAAGILASLGNRILLSSPSPALRQVDAWDRFLVPRSRRLDPILRHRIGKSVFAVWRGLGGG
jgi:SAM-dependent methyltransferase